LAPLAANVGNSRKGGAMRDSKAMAEEHKALRAQSICVFTRMWRGNGTGLFAQGLVSGLLSTGAQVTFICPLTTSASFEAPRAGLRRLRQPREADGAPRARRLVASMARILGGTLALARARLRHRDFVMSMPDPLVIAAFQIVLLRLTGARIVYVAHDVLPHAWKFSPRWRFWERASYAACYHAASAVVVLSEPTRRTMHEEFPKLVTPVHVIEHGPLSAGAPCAAPGGRRLLCFGTLRQNKGILEAIEGVRAACAAGLQVCLTVAGAPHPEDPDYADQCLRAAQHAPGIIDMQVGYVEDDAVAVLINQCDALLMPYGAFYSQSGVALLAAAHMRPIITTGAGGLSSLLSEGFPAVQIAQPCTAETVSAAIYAFFSEPLDVWQQRSGAYYDYVMEQRGWPYCARAYLDIFRKQAPDTTKA